MEWREIDSNFCISERVLIFLRHVVTVEGSGTQFHDYKLPV
jgi:hypothetical protein